MGTFETDDNYSIRFQMKKHYSHSTSFVLVIPAGVVDGRIALKSCSSRSSLVVNDLPSTSPPDDNADDDNVGSRSTAARL